ncbi:MAG TPA: flagellar export chaperone FliS [Thermodesulfobacteriaceae bacterium]|nr:flagellar export chaperone FliS [Thermodesulfobacteriaceae bacterium]
MYNSQRIAYSAYQRNDILNLTPGEIIARLYMALERALISAREDLEKGTAAAKGENIGKAVAIIGELQASLNIEEGGEIAERLHALYSYLIYEITMANLKNDGSKLDDVIRIVEPLAEAWITLGDGERYGKGMVHDDGERCPEQRILSAAL